MRGRVPPARPCRRRGGRGAGPAAAPHPPVRPQHRQDPGAFSAPARGPAPGSNRVQVIIEAYFRPAVRAGMRALMLVHRQTLAHATAARFTSEEIPVLNYLNPDSPLSSGQFVIISPESLWRCGLEGAIPRYDLVVMDELTSLLEHVTSSKTMHASHDPQKTREHRTFVLSSVLNQADLIVASDGYIRDHDVDFLMTTLRPNAHVAWLVNIQKTNPNHFRFCPFSEVLEQRLVNRCNVSGPSELMRAVLRSPPAFLRSPRWTRSSSCVRPSASRARSTTASSPSAPTWSPSWACSPRRRPPRARGSCRCPRRGPPSRCWCARRPSGPASTSRSRTSPRCTPSSPARPSPRRRRCR